MAADSERVRLDEIIKAMFSTSNGVLLKLLNGIFDENFKEDEVEISMENKEFPKENYEDKEIPLIDLIRADFLAKFTEKVNNKKHYYHIEFQIKNDNDMIIRTFEYGFNYAKEVARTEGIDRNLLYFPKQKIIYMEENRNIEDVLNMRIIFPNSQEIEYLNDKYFKNVEIEEEVKTMTKTLYDPEVEKRGKADLIIKLLIKKFQVNPEDYKEKLMALSAETIEDIGIQLLDMNSIEDLNKYFKK